MSELEESEHSLVHSESIASIKDVTQSVMNSRTSFMHDSQFDLKENSALNTPRSLSLPLHSLSISSDLKKWYNKRYLGGYRNKISLTEYFNAESQTLTPQEKIAMTTRSTYISSNEDVEIVPQAYTTAEEYHAKILETVITIQCFFRRCFARRKVKRLIKERDERMITIEKNTTLRKELIEKKKKADIESRLHPKNKSDFELLYNGLENWRVKETNRINNLGYSEPARLAALADLLDQEAVLLQKIDRLRTTANIENKDKGIYKLLENMASAKKWPAVNGTAIIMVDTPNTIRARELRDLYHAINMSLLSVDERLQILLHVKFTVKEFDCNLTREIVGLIDREADLISRGRAPQTMEGLRKRITNLFLQFIQTPEFNPESSNYQKFPDAGLSWKRDQSIYFCGGCTKYLPCTEFYLSTTMKHLGKCKACSMKENIANSRKDDSSYSRMLKVIITTENTKRKHTGVPVDPHYNAMALLQESDMRHLVDVIWNKQSVISSSRNIADLLLTRWDPKMEISPWNCILLTKSEAVTHDKQNDPLSLYSDEFKNKISRKHMAAKQHFIQLPAIEKFIHRNFGDNLEGEKV